MIGAAFALLTCVSTGAHLNGVHIACRWMEKEYGHHVAQSLPQESDTGASAKKIMEEGNLQQYTLQEVSFFGLHCHFVTDSPVCGLGGIVVLALPNLWDCLLLPVTFCENAAKNLLQITLVK